MTQDTDIKADSPPSINPYRTETDEVKCQAYVAEKVLHVKEVKGEDSTFYSASLPYRSIEALDPDRDKAIQNLLLSYADLSRTGAFNPRNPQAKGVGPIQHVMGILSEHLARQVEQRRTILRDSDGDLSQEALRKNEVISAIATAMASLGRIKEA